MFTSCVLVDVSSFPLDEIWLGCGERQGAKVCVVNCGEEKLKLEVPLREVSLFIRKPLPAAQQ